jgi:2'-5' RNA ligase
MPPRPALPRRAVVAFLPELPAAIEDFRAVHDPLAGTLPAHVTLVFPFASSLSGVQVAAHVRRIVARWPVVPVTLSGAGAYDHRWVHLRVTRGRDAIVELHDRLYRGALAPFLRREFDYEPHVTIGRAATPAACEALVAAARSQFVRPVDAVLRSLAIVALPSDDRAVVERDVALNG